MTPHTGMTLRRFKLWSTRLHDRHNAAQGVVMNLYSDWKDDLEALKEKAIITIQRQYRKRKADGVSIKAAEEEAQRRRDAIRIAREEEERRIAEARAQRQADAERQMARARRLLRERDAAAAAAEERRYQTMQQAGQYEVERRFRLAQLRNAKIAIRAWKLEVVIRKCALGGVRTWLVTVLGSWHKFAHKQASERNSAARIQGLFRGRRDRLYAIQLRKELTDKMAKAGAFLRRVVHRFAVVRETATCRHRRCRLPRLCTHRPPRPSTSPSRPLATPSLVTERARGMV